ncbi:dipeptide/oligopeptide/nickel ABC transporter permease/ATP-binding protein [Streptomyces sp. NPDC050535]|uniref:dipeptide/oligopeptide/nickel ABC transporter permease/ATP-binding protein n=1 Tax=Streptomyces sp. NPDC050535 TaxID=3365626 RepID=UPI0037AF435B
MTNVPQLPAADAVEAAPAKAAETARVPGEPARRRGVLRALVARPLAAVALAVLLVIVLASLFAPLLTDQSPTRVDLDLVLAHPGGEHLLGGDGSGRDVFARLLYGGRSSLLSGAIALATALVIGVPAGLVAGYRGGRVDAVATWICNLLMSIPAVIALLAVIAALGSSIVPTMTAFGVLLAPGSFQLTRSSVRGVRNELYVDAARVSGLSEARIVRRHILTVVRPPLVIWATLMVGLVIVTQAGLQYLGVGDTTSASWGAMVNDAQRNIYTAPSLLYPPGLVIGVTAACFGILGSALGDVLTGDGRARRKRRMRGDLIPAPAGTEAVSAPAAPEPQDEALVEVRDLRVSYAQPDGTTKEVVHGVSLTVRPGEVLGLVGESGSGKSQTAFALLGLLPREARVQAAALRMGMHDLSRLTSRQWQNLRGRRMAYVPQDPMSNLDPSFPVGQQLVVPLRRHLGLSRQEAAARALDLLDRVGVADPRKTFADYPHQLSGGLAQRVLIAAAVSCEPEFLVADEPTTALDVTVQAEVLDLLRGLQKELGMSMLLVTHDLGVVADLCDRVAVMRAGRLVENAPAQHIFAEPRHPYTRSLLASVLEHSATRPPLGTDADPVPPTGAQ